MKPELRIVTVAWPEDWRLERTKSSFHRTGVYVRNLCKKPGDFTGLYSKLKLVGEYLETAQSSHTMFVDGYDVIASPEFRHDTMLARFGWLDSPIVFSAERNCWPDPELASKYPDCKTSFRFLNSGLYIGETIALRNLFRMMLSTHKNHENFRDQRAFTMAHLALQFSKLDHNCILFQSLHMAGSDVNWTSERFFNDETYSNPLVIHGNGSSDLTRVSKVLMLPVSSQ